MGLADDLAVVVVAKYLEEVELIANESVDIIRRWLDSVGLTLADHKTEVLLVSRRKVKEKVTVKVGSQAVESKDEIKYLGVWLDLISRRTRNTHAKRRQRRITRWRECWQIPVAQEVADECSWRGS